MTPNKQLIKRTIKTMWAKIVTHGFDLEDEIDKLEIAPEAIETYFNAEVRSSYRTYKSDIEQVIEDDTTMETKIAKLMEFAKDEIVNDCFETAVEMAIIAEAEEDYMCNEYELTA